jgi:hypothetical protein
MKRRSNYQPIKTNPSKKSIDEQLLQVRGMANRLVVEDGKESYTPMRSEDIRPMAIGDLMAHAMLKDDEESAQAIGWIYIHRHPSDSMNNFMTRAMDVLIDSNRPDLITPMVKKIYSTCLALWRREVDMRGHLIAPLKMVYFPNTEDLETVIVKDLCDAPRSYGSRGLVAWINIGESAIIAMSPDQFSPTNERYFVMMKAITEVMSQIKDSRAWAAPILYKSIKVLGANIEASEQTKTVRSLATFLTEKGAAAWIRSIADQTVGYDDIHSNDDGLTGRPGLAALIPFIIDQHPGLTLEQWLCSGIPGELSPDRERLKGGIQNARIRDKLNKSPLNDESCPDKHLSYVLAAYEKVVSWIGADHGPEMSRSTEQMLKKLIERLNKIEGGAPTFAIQAALDLRDLRDVVTDRDEWGQPIIAELAEAPGRRKSIM